MGLMITVFNGVCRDLFFLCSIEAYERLHGFDKGVVIGVYRGGIWLFLGFVEAYEAFHGFDQGFNMVFFGDLGLYSLIGSYIIFLRVSWGLGVRRFFPGSRGFYRTF